MKFNSNKFLLIILLVAFSGVESYAQCYKTVGSRGGSSAFSLEIGAGMPILISPTNDSKFGDNKKVELGLRYLPEEPTLVCAVIIVLQVYRTLVPNLVIMVIN